VRKKEFINHLCHELRNPLQGIMVATELLLDAISLNNKVDINLLMNSLQKGSLWLKQVLDHALTISKLESRVGTSKACYSPCQQIQDTIRILRPRAK